jgi:HEAT repeat protein
MLVRQEVAQLLLRSEYDGFGRDVVKLIEDPSETPDFRAYCVQYLWQWARAQSADSRESALIALRACLDSDAVQVSREALLALVRLEDQQGEEAAVEWLMSENADGVRDAAIRCVREIGLREHTPRIREFLYDKDEIVRIVAIAALSQWGDEKSHPAVEEAAKSDSIRLRRCAELALKRLDEAKKKEPVAAEP